MRPGSGFISVDNDDLTAENCWLARDAVGLDSAAHWNIAPVYLGPTKNKPNAEELAAGATDLRRMLPLFEQLQAIVLCGEHAKNGWERHVAPFYSGATVLKTWHPSGRGINPPGRRDEFFKVVARAKALAG
jgi:uracil-DNA glycosylase